MKNPLRALLFFAVAATSTAQAATPISHPSLNKTQADFVKYISGYETPEFFDHNEKALQARLKLLDQAPAGANAKVLTFVWDNGEATRLLATHMCLAAKRGVRVQFMVDSKYGDRPGVPDAFDAKNAHQVNEEIYQMLANCGVEVKVHNHIAEFDKLNRLVKATLPAVPRTWTGSLVGLVSDNAAIWASLSGLVSDLEDTMKDSLKDERNKLTKEDRKSLKVLGDGLTSMMRKALWAAINADSEEERLALIIASLQEVQQQVATANITKRVAPTEVRRFLYDLISKIQNHPDLGAFYRQVRVFNRLNHRKLFWVESQGETCMILGGRNLGDHYLQWDRHHDEFMDGDVLICDQHLKTGDENVLEQARASFTQLWENQDQEDPVNVRPVLTTIAKNFDFKYKFLMFSEDKLQYWGNPMWVIQPYEAAKDLWHKMDTSLSWNSIYVDLRSLDRSVPAPTAWEDASQIRGRQILGSKNWRVRTSTWNTRKDEVRAELIAAINREQQVVYIETAYSEFNSELRNAIEGALKRGVQVKVITNSIFVSDGGSKAIRLLMARWTRQMLEQYPKHYSVGFATLEHGHMIHFKGASFQCQKTGDRLYRLSLVGSHNFHGRSGYSDKEHAIFWEQDPRVGCREKVGIAGDVSVDQDLMNMRAEWYTKLKAERKVSILKAYRTLEEEFREAIATKKLSEKGEKLARTTLLALYKTQKGPDGKLYFVRDSEGRALLKSQDEFLAFMELLAESGISDLVGTLL